MWFHSSLIVYMTSDQHNTTIIYLDQKNANGRIYTKDIILSLLEKKHLVVENIMDIPPQNNFNDDVNLELLCGTANNFSIVENEVRCDIKFINKYKHLYELVEQLTFRPKGFGKIGEDGIVSDYIPLCIQLISKKDDAWNIDNIN